MSNEIKTFITQDKEFFPIKENNKENFGITTGNLLTIKIYPKDFHVSDYGRDYPKEKTDRNWVYVLDGEGEVISVHKKKRSVIKKFSFGASRRLKFVLRNISHLMNVKLTLTYPNEFPMDGELVKRHLHNFLEWLRYRGLRYIWLLEFQERGAPHFHILVDKKIPYQDVADIWYKIVDSGDINHLQAGTQTKAIRSKDGIAHYLTNYMKKWEQKTVPKEYVKVGRFWGCSKGLLPCVEFRVYGSKEDINLLKQDLKIVRQFNRGQKRIWNRNDKKKGKKNRFKKYYNGYHRDSYSLKVTNYDKLLAEIQRRNIDFFPLRLIGLSIQSYQKNSDI